MTSERFRQLEDLFHGALALPSDRRASFLTATCGDDASLRREVEALIDQQDGSLLSGGMQALLPRDTPPRGGLEGRSIGGYLLGPLIGSGSMGEVYRARDTKLGRDVAVKILSGILGHPPDRLARFDREARVLAAINHPHIAAIHGTIDGEAGKGLVLELVEGITLAERLETSRHAGADRGGLPVDEALSFARQIADALHAAHRKGIVHRDLKPDNLKITGGGIVKVLDFGLAKIEDPLAASPGGVQVLATRQGVLLGTVAYMSPEQARGQAVDKRTDVWAFGCVLYEMLTGERTFRGDTSADVLASITTADPDWSRLPASTPPRIRRLLRRCLDKDPDRRLHDMADARVEIDDAIDGVAEDPAASPARTSSAVARAVWPLVVALLASAATAALVWKSPDPPAPVHAALPLPADVSVWAIGRGSSVAIAPDGRHVVFAGVEDGVRQLFVQPLAGGATRRVIGTEGAANPFVSPDGRWIGFVDDSNGGSLKRVPIEGGTPLTIVAGNTLPEFTVTGAWWHADDTIVFTSTSTSTKGIWRVAAAGGRPSRVSTPGEGEYNHSWPQVTPDGRSVLFTIWGNTSFEGSRLAVRSLSGGEPRVLVDGASYGRIVARPGGGHWLLYARTEGLMAAGFDLAALRIVGTAVPVRDDLLVNLSGGAHFAVSDNGTLAYVPGGLDEADKTAVWVDRQGIEREIGVIPGLGFQYRLSPDGTRLVRPNAVGPTRDLYVDSLSARRTPRRLSFGDFVSSAVWTPDSSRIVYASGVSPSNLFWRAADGSDTEERLTTSDQKQIPNAVSPDGRLLAFVSYGPDGSSDLWLRPLAPGGEPRLLVGTPAAEAAARFSPDGRWIVYQSRTGASAEIYLTSVARPTRQLPVSNGEGWGPMWSPDGREIYFRNRRPSSGEGHMLAASVDLNGPEPVIGEPRVLFPTPYQGEGDVGPDGRFLLLHRTRQASPARFIPVVIDWFAELDVRVPAR